MTASSGILRHRKRGCREGRRHCLFLFCQNT